MQKMIRAALVLLVALSLLLGIAGAEEKPTLQIHQINVGFADCYLIICGDTSFMIDCGIDQEKTAPSVDEYLQSAGVDKLDACIITHYHRDHVRNMNRVLSGFGDENTIVYGPSPAMHRDFAPIVAGEYRQMLNYDEIQLGDVHLTCVGPTKLAGAGAVNKDSLNILLTYGGRRILFTGDYVRSKDIIDQHRELVENIDVLKFPHHGLEPYCVDPWVVKIMNPKWILIPGQDDYSVKKLLRQRYMTETTVVDAGEGHVVVLTDGESLEVFTHVELGQFSDL